MMMPKLFLFVFCCLCMSAISAQNAVITNDKMNVFYAGLDNPISVAVAGVASENVIIEGAGCGITIKPTTTGKYIVNVNQAGGTILTLKDKKTGKIYATETYRCKRIPDPVVSIAGKTRGAMGTGQMAAQIKFTAEATGFDIDVNFEVVSYTLYYKIKRGESISLQGNGTRFSGQIAEAIKSAGVGDTYTFADIKVRCPGDVVARNASTITINIK